MTTTKEKKGLLANRFTSSFWDSKIKSANVTGKEKWLGYVVGPFGVMGGYMQPQGHVQVVMNTVDFNLNPQMALDAPRWQWMKGREVSVEASFSNQIAQQLAARGHDITVALNSSGFGRGQMIVRLDNGILVGGTESRTDSNIACF